MVQVQTQWYRAPEVLLGLGAYSPAVDVWSLGCVFGELLLGRPLFQGDSEIGQLVQICKLLGTPTEAQWPGWTQLPHALAAFPRFPPPPAAVLQQTLFPPPCPACGGADGLEAVEQHALDLLKVRYVYLGCCFVFRPIVLAVISSIPAR
jgi:serine/threonine protein kinase